MGRKEKRKAEKKEKNALIEVCRIQRRYIPDLFDLFENTCDPRNQAYITYPNRVMLGQMYFKGIVGLRSMQSMTEEFNDKHVSMNLSRCMGGCELEMLPHHVTENEYLERLDPQEIQGIIQKIVYRMIRRKTFSDARFRKKWLVIVDGTQLYSGGRRINEYCLETRHNKGTEEETVQYHQNVLEAKIYLGDGIMCSIASEFIENSPEDQEKWKEMSEEKIKQDCETKAFRRLADRLKTAFPKLPIILLGDSLYASEPVMKICEEKGWDYLIRFKSGSIPSVAEEYDALRQNEMFGKGKESGRSGDAEFINAIDYNGRSVNVVRFREKKIIKKKETVTEFQWLTSLEVSLKNVEKVVAQGRLRWKIENQGFNRQKHWSGDITHACSWNRNALKNHYLLLQISDFIRQLYEYFFLVKNEIKRTQKNISSTLLRDFGERLTGEDIFNAGLRTAVVP